MKADRRWRTRFVRAAAVCVLCTCGPAGVSATPPAAAMNADHDPTTEALLTTLEKTPDRPVRVIVTTRPDDIDAVADAARKAGAHVERIAGQPLLVIEGRPAHLRAALRSGKVVHMQRDDAAPTN
jgi:hypothetical protein